MTLNDLEGHFRYLKPL